MENKDLEFTLAIGELILKYGLPATVELIRTWKSKNPTIADIEELKGMVPPPDTYFEN
jgi:hypothetical protein